MSFFIDRSGIGGSSLEEPRPQKVIEISAPESPADEDQNDLTMEIPSGSDLEHEDRQVVTALNSVTNIEFPSGVKKRKPLGVLKSKSRAARLKDRKSIQSTRKSVSWKSSEGSERILDSDDRVAETEGMFFCGDSKKRKNKKVFEYDESNMMTKMDIPEDLINKYQSGSKFHSSHIKQAKVKHQLEKQESKLSEAAEKAAKVDMFMSEQPGYIDIGDEELLSLDQDTIQKNVDISSAEKRFDLSLKQFGPYKVNYTRNGRYLLIGGKMGHVASFDWNKKSLCSEINVMETVNDLCWLHNENMFAVAQKRWVYIYDRAGVELHALRQLDRVKSMQFLPYHFLLATMNDLGFLSYLDVSIGRVVSTLATGLKGVREIKQNPQNAVIYSAHPNGVVNMWAPSSNKPLAKMLCHLSAVATLAVDKTGNYLSTCGIDRRLRIFDLRMYRPIHSFKLSVSARSLDFSQRGMLAAAFPRNVDIFKGVCESESAVKPYLTHRLHRTQIGNVEFCPYEDVLGVGHHMGISSLLVPGAGEPNFDALESNPFATKQQRREAEVKSLLDKIQPEMISLEKNLLLKVHEQQPKDIASVPQPLKISLKKKARGGNKAMKREQKKSGIKEDERRARAQEVNRKRAKEEKLKKHVAKKNSETQPFDPLARFATKNK